MLAAVLVFFRGPSRRQLARAWRVVRAAVPPRVDRRAVGPAQCSASKLPHYPLVALPALAVLVALEWERRDGVDVRGRSRARRRARALRAALPLPHAGGGGDVEHARSPRCGLPRCSSTRRRCCSGIAGVFFPATRGCAAVPPRARWRLSSCTRSLSSGSCARVRSGSRSRSRARSRASPVPRRRSTSCVSARRGLGCYLPEGHAIVEGPGRGRPRSPLGRRASTSSRRAPEPRHGRARPRHNNASPRCKGFRELGPREVVVLARLGRSTLNRARRAKDDESSASANWGELSLRAKRRSRPGSPSRCSPAAARSRTAAAGARTRPSRRAGSASARPPGKNAVDPWTWCPLVGGRGSSRSTTSTDASPTGRATRRRSVRLDCQRQERRHQPARRAVLRLVRVDGATRSGDETGTWVTVEGEGRPGRARGPQHLHQPDDLSPRTRWDASGPTASADHRSFLRRGDGLASRRRASAPRTSRPPICPRRGRRQVRAGLYTMAIGASWARVEAGRALSLGRPCSPRARRTSSRASCTDAFPGIGARPGLVVSPRAGRRRLGGSGWSGTR